MDMLNKRMPVMDRNAEIDEINRELALLRSRYASYRRAAEIMRAIFMVLIPLGAIVAAIFAVKLFLFDTLYGVFFLGAVLIFVAAITWFVRSIDLRWIDFVSQQARGIYSPTFFYPDADPSLAPRSEAERIERQIAGRERLLSELGVSAPSTDPIQ